MAMPEVPEREKDRARSVVKIIERMYDAKGSTTSILQRVADHVLGRGDFTTDRETDTSTRNYYIYDPTSINESDRLCSTLYSILFAGRFFSFEADDPKLDDDDALQEWLELATRITYNEVMRSSAGFAQVAGENIHEIVDFGAGGIIVDETDDGSLVFSTLFMENLLIDEDGHGKPKRIGRIFKFTNDQLWSRWGQKMDDSVEKWALERKANSDPNGFTKVYHIVEPNDAKLKDMLGSSKPYVGEYVHADMKITLERRFYEENPMPVGRWDRRGKSPYGTCPGRKALSPQMMLNEMERTLLETGHRALDPVLLVPGEGVLGQVSTKPGSTIIYDMDVSSQRGHGIEYLESKSRFAVGEDAMERRIAAVKAAFHSEIHQLPEQPYYTALHIDELSRQAVKYIGHSLQRYQNEIIEPVLKRVFGILLRNGKIPAPPTQVGSIKTRYVSPAMRAQQAEEAEAVVKYRLSAINLAGVNEDALDALDPIQSLRAEAESYGLSPGSGGVATTEQIAAKREAKNQQAEETQGMNRALEAAEVYNKMAPAVAAANEGGGVGA